MPIYDWLEIKQEKENKNMVPKSIEERLADSQANLSAVDTGFFKPQPGAYECVIFGSKITQNSKELLQLQIMLGVINGSEEGKKFSVFMDLEGQYLLSIKIFMDVMGLSGKSLIDLVALARDGFFDNTCVLVECKPNPKKPQYNNLYIKKVIDATPPVVAQTVANPGPSGVPF